MPNYQIYFHCNPGIPLTCTTTVEAQNPDQAKIHLQHTLPRNINITAITILPAPQKAPPPDAFGHGIVNDQVPPGDHEP